MNKLKSINLKKVIKVITLIIGFALIVFISFFNATFDFAHFNWGEWGANTSILVGIMIYGILMGNSVGTDVQKEKIGGRFQVACNEYNETLLTIQAIKIYFSQFWLWYKAKQLKEKKIEYLVDNQFDTKVATAIVNEIEKEDLVVGKFVFDENDPVQKIYVKGKAKLKKINNEQLEIVKKIFEINLDTFGESYYLSLFDDGLGKIKEVEVGKAIQKKIERDKRNSFILKITSSLIISIVWSALTINDFISEGGDAARKKAWANLLSRLSALITSFVSGFSTSVVNVRDQSNAIENKANILKDFKTSYESKSFPMETYEEMIEREYQEQLKEENS